LRSSPFTYCVRCSCPLCSNARPTRPVHRSFSTSLVMAIMGGTIKIARGLGLSTSEAQRVAEAHKDALNGRNLGVDCQRRVWISAMITEAIMPAAKENEKNAKSLPKTLPPPPTPEPERSGSGRSEKALSALSAGGRSQRHSRTRSKAMFSPPAPRETMVNLLAKKLF
jgi:hypothetical protein